MIAPTYISSSNINAAGYRLGSLFLRFNNGGCYRYDKVPYTIFDAMIKVESAGKYFHKFVKGAFEYVKLDKDPFVA